MSSVHSFYCNGLSSFSVTPGGVNGLEDKSDEGLVGFSLCLERQHLTLESNLVYHFSIHHQPSHVQNASSVPCDIIISSSVLNYVELVPLKFLWYLVFPGARVCALGCLLLPCCRCHALLLDPMFQGSSLPRGRRNSGDAPRLAKGVRPIVVACAFY
ncbi:hypothetical protein BGZ63DRAFT_122103 [Mariannaea sp. PMI_226]|nr:hypothetical protein BGZ63DRAFT_122103 [Mariannaea sp. PMI_226]